MDITAEDRRPRSAYVTALLWGDAGLIAGIAAGVVLALPFYPEQPDEGFAILGWAILVAGLAGLLGLVGGVVSLVRGLRRSGAAHPVATAVTFVPVALLLAVLTAGVGVLAAPAVAYWIVDGFTRRSAPVGYGPVVAPARTGLPQRILVALVLCGLATAYTLSKIGHSLGGEVYGELVVWAICLPALIVLPALLLWRRLPWPALAGGIAVLAALAGLAVPGAVENAHPSPARLERLADGLAVPDGQRIVDRASWLAENRITDDPLPVTVLLSTPPDSPLPGSAEPSSPRSAASEIPLALAMPPLLEESFANRPFPALPMRLAFSPDGEVAADAWEAALRADGWEVDEFSTPAYRSSGNGGSSWLPDAAQSVVDASGRVRYERGPWVRASVVPYGDAALVVFSTRP